MPIAWSFREPPLVEAEERLREPTGYILAVECEKADHDSEGAAAVADTLKQKALRETRGGSAL